MVRLLFAWDTWCPVRGAFPVTWHTRDMGYSNGFFEGCKARHYSQKTRFFQLIPLGFSEHPALREGQPRAGRHDEVVEHLHVDESQGLGERARQCLVLDAGLGDAGRMVVREDERGGV